MKKLTLVLFSFAHLWATPLIYISNDTQSLKALNERYQHKLLINDKRVYLIPNECKLERYFGGSSQGKLTLVEQPVQTKKILITQEVFEAKQTKDIQDSLQLQKDIALIEGTESKEFLADDEGRGFGGASEVSLDYTFQKIHAKKEHFLTTQEPQSVETKEVVLPSCTLLENGSGYKLSGIIDAHFYHKGKFTSLESDIQLFN